MMSANYNRLSKTLIDKEIHQHVRPHTHLPRFSM
jgi:hypothetical protein